MQATLCDNLWVLAVLYGGNVSVVYLVAVESNAAFHAAAAAEELLETGDGLSPLFGQLRHRGSVAEHANCIRPVELARMVQRVRVTVVAFVGADVVVEKVLEYASLRQDAPRIQRDRKEMATSLQANQA